MSGSEHLSYGRSKFRTRLPLDRRYTQGHAWLLPEADGVVRVGFTRFATRMLGEIVEFAFEAKPGRAIEIGEVIGWFEGFKAVSDVYAPLAGTFLGPNPELEAVTERIHHSPYDQGWLYRVAGGIPDDALTAEDYARFLDGTIDRMMGDA